MNIKPFTQLFAKTYKLGKTDISIPCTIQGRGIDVTVIEMTEDELFDINMDTDGHIMIRDLTIVVKKNAKHAIKYDGSKQVHHHPNVSLIADRLSPRLSIHNVNIEAKDGHNFETALLIRNALEVSVFNCSFNQKDNVRKGRAIQIDGYYQPVAFNIESCRILNFDYGIYSEEAEGLKIVNNNIVANTIGVRVSNLSQQPEVNINGNHISSDLHNVYLEKCNNVHIGGGNLFFRREGGLSKETSSSVFMREVKNSIVVGNIFTSFNWNHIHTRHCDNITIGANNHSNALRNIYDDSGAFAV